MTLVSADAELALRRLGTLGGFYLQSRRRLGPPRSGRLKRLSQPAAPGQLRTLHEVTLMRVVSIVEAFALDLGEKSVRARLGQALVSPPSASPSRDMVQYLFDEKLGTLGTGSWDRLMDVWKKALGVGFGDFQSYEHLNFIRLTRHAIAHRVGEYTTQYRRAASKRLIALGIDPEKATGLIPLEIADVEDAFKVARDFVLWLDSRANP